LENRGEKIYRLGCDIGGTFTDVVLLNTKTHELTVGKVLTTPEDPSVGALRGIQEVLAARGVNPRSELADIIHGTTLVINAIINRTGARTALLVTEGFRDFLEIGRGGRWDNYDMYIEMPRHLVPRRHRKGIRERIHRDGRIIVEFDETQAESTVRELLGEGIEAFAVCFLHSFRNPVHEKKMKEVIHRIEPSVQVTLSSELIPEIREYERASTTVANAYTLPNMKRYISKFQKELEGARFGGQFFMMLSHGGITTPETASDFPIRVLESGPAAGAIYSSFLARQKGIDKLLSFDMGGTTAKSCLIHEGKPVVTKEFEIARISRLRKGSGLPINLPVIEMVEIGAGGGSIARVDEMGLVTVGPRSAEASPGPACYGLGGQEPTVTDADLVLGYLNEDFFLGGRMALDRARARGAIQNRIAGPARLTLEEAAWGIHMIVNENMARSARAQAVEKGLDITEYSMVAFGGAGPVHAFGVARILGLRQFIVPAGAGVASAVGFLVAPLSFDFIRTYMMHLDKIDWRALNEIYKEMEAEGRQYLHRAGVRDEAITVRRSAEMRYVLQGREIDVPIPAGRLTGEHLPLIQEAFNQEHAQKYGWMYPELDVMGLNWKIVVSGPDPRFQLREVRKDNGNPAKALKGERAVYFPEAGFAPCKVYDRCLLPPDVMLDGPLVVEEAESTTVVGPGARCQTDPYLNLTVFLRVC
jgi:N-methylhydantoinase A